MNTIKLQATGFELEVPDNVHYHDDGVVKSIVGHSTELCKRYGGKHPENSIKRVKQRCAELIMNNKLLIKIAKKIEICAGNAVPIYLGEAHTLEEAVKRGIEVHYHTYVLDINGEPDITKNQGHEEGHFINYIDRRDLLEKGFKDLRLKTDGLYESSVEVMCELTGIYAVLNRFPDLRKDPVSLMRKLRFSIHCRDSLLDYLKRNSKWGLNENAK